VGKLYRLHQALSTVLAQVDARIFVETGTFHGESLAYAKSLPFSELHSVELSPTLHAAAAARFAGDPRLLLHQGDSAVVLPQILRDIHEPALFWLDAHFCFLDSARGPTDCPLVEEVEAIVAHERATGLQHLVLIDDYHILGTTPSSGWVVTEEVVFVPEADWGDVTPDRVRDLFGAGRQFHVWGDTLFVLPASVDVAAVQPPRDPYAEAAPLVGP
jgi:hypothetical protein